MKNNSFKSAQHSLNYHNLMVKKANRKQPVKIFSEEERKKFAEERGLGVSDKPVTQPKSRNRSVVEEKTNHEEIDWNQIPAELFALLNK